MSKNQLLEVQNDIFWTKIRRLSNLPLDYRNHWWFQASTSQKKLQNNCRERRVLLWDFWNTNFWSTVQTCKKHQLVFRWSKGPLKVCISGCRFRRLQSVRFWHSISTGFFPTNQASQFHCKFMDTQYSAKKALKIPSTKCRYLQLCSLPHPPRHGLPGFQGNQA